MTDTPKPDLDELRAPTEEQLGKMQSDAEAGYIQSLTPWVVRWLIARAREAMAALELLASIAQVADDGADCPCCEMTVAEDGYVHDAECPVPKYRLAADARRTP